VFHTITLLEAAIAKSFVTFNYKAREFDSNEAMVLSFRSIEVISRTVCFITRIWQNVII